ncbi:PREDICTED: stromal interaction molecule homolog [Priapulus caudatus]|uniref:Stromal interaction molecule homolog n=1 Tax=Priapulus caudatus TaxID=37621 RepID=A0ABM1E5S0_PRICU|nr:PREDICTED: stromal interaction molecule homolog [Priapulus caudatus]
MLCVISKSFTWRLFVLWTVVLLFHSACVMSQLLDRQISSQSQLKFGPSPGVGNQVRKDIIQQDCDESCRKDEVAFSAIAALHKHLDDDSDGSIDITESDEFLKEELHYNNKEKAASRQMTFHQQDEYVTLDEMWQKWVHSSVHNWTTEDVVEWLVSYVDLPQYAPKFKELNIDGTALPRLALAADSIMQTYIGIVNPSHRRKLTLKAMDIVLFGAPKSTSSVLKDSLLASSLLIAIGAGWFGYTSNRQLKEKAGTLQMHWNGLQLTEEKLRELQRKLVEKEDEARDREKEMEGVHVSGNEINRLRLAEEKLAKLGRDLPKLQMWLQYTHELDKRNYNRKYAEAERQLRQAKDACERIHKKKDSLLSSFRIGQLSSVEEVDARIVKARQALMEVTIDLQERLFRWEQIEALLGLPLRMNQGLEHLQNALHLEESLLFAKRRGMSSMNLHSVSQEDGDDNSLHEFGAGPPRESVGRQREMPSSNSVASLASMSSKLSLNGNSR